MQYLQKRYKLTCLSQLLIEPIFKMKLWGSRLHWFLCMSNT